MIEGTFDIAVDTPKLHRRGICALKSEGETIEAELSVGDLDALRFTGTCHDKEFAFTGTGTFGALGEIEYDAKGEVWGNSLSITCTSSVGKIDIFGTRLSASAGSMQSSHEYMMKASTGNFDFDDSAMYSGLYSDAF